jgi:hypothetical protein
VDRTTPEPGAGPPAARSEGCDSATDDAFRAWAAAGFSGSVAIATGGWFTCLAAYGQANAEAGTAHGGDLTVRSPGPAGDGCAFRLTLRATTGANTREDR